MGFLGRLMRGLGRNSGRRFWRDDSAATAVEFAMVSPVFFLMIGCILETGLMLFTEYVLQTSVQEAARFVRTGQAQTAEMTQSVFKTKICDLAKYIIDCNGAVTVYMTTAATFQSLNATVPSYLSIGVKADGTTDAPTFSCGGPAVPVALIATYDWQFSIPYFMKFFGNIAGGNKRRIAGFAVFRNEPFPSSSKVCK